MHKLLSMFMVISLLAVTQGCGDSGSAPTQQVKSPRVATPPNDPIAQIAYEFFDAVRARDSDAASALLTPLAVQRRDELGLKFELPISDTAEFSVSKANIFQADMAAVETVWTEVDAQGQVQREELTIVLKLGNGQWGVMAVLSGLGNNQDLEGIDFEKPDQPIDSSALRASLPSNDPAPRQATRPAAAQEPFRQ